eukprot:TRINITY_DN6176_c0_g3_i1.p1 TRINITY_DN6176_c0_g3~~TRINITY_DN6176_c0_g3_i1.p1  ORF type:complete len:864 (+),score=60.21 TRINITY_DN6176_c0_g3_i1:56-2647(+)
MASMDGFDPRVPLKGECAGDSTAARAMVADVTPTPPGSYEPRRLASSADGSLLIQTGISWRWDPRGIAKRRDLILTFILHVYSAYNFFVALLTIWSFALNTLIIWYVGFFRVTSESGMSVLRFFSLLGRSWVVIRFASHLMVSALQMIQDCFRLEPFQIYRCFLCGGAVACYRSNSLDPMTDLGMFGAWRYTERWRGLLDIVVQVVIYTSLNVVPFLLAVTNSWKACSMCASLAGLFHVIVFHSARTITEVVAKVYSWRDMRDVSAASMVEISESVSVGDGINTSSSRKCRVTSSCSTERSNPQARDSFPCSICSVRLRSVSPALVVFNVIIALFAAVQLHSLHFFIYILMPLPCLEICQCVFAFLWKRVAQHLSDQVAIFRWAPLESVRGRSAQIQAWADVHCGLQVDFVRSQYSLMLGLVLSQLILVSVIGWVGSMIVSAIGLLVVFVRILTLKYVRPWDWLIAFCEVFFAIGSATILTFYFSGFYSAGGVLLMGLSIQFTMVRHHIRFHRAFNGLNVSLQTALVLIVIIAVMSVKFEVGEFEVFCSPRTLNTRPENCRSFSTGALPVKAHDRGRPQFCDMSFELRHARSKLSEGSLFLPDFMRISILSYVGDESFESSVRRWLPGWRVTYRHFENIDTYNLSPFQELTSPGNTTSVFVMRGTHSFVDVMQDMSLYSPVFVPQMFASFFWNPTTPVLVTTRLWCQLFFGAWIPKSYYNALLQHVHASIQADPNRTFYLTGHSLGGGMVKLVSGETNVPAVTFSSPGVLGATEMAYDDNIDIVRRLENLLTTVVPESDVVPRVDTQVGTVVKVGCNGSSLSCHSFGETLCSLLDSCGHQGVVVDVPCNLCPSHRHLFKGCEP